jgi:hypothetical protein
MRHGAGELTGNGGLRPGLSMRHFTPLATNVRQPCPAPVPDNPGQAPSQDLRLLLWGGCRDTALVVLLCHEHYKLAC